MASLINCPDCNNQILSRMGTICPNCGYTVGYFNHDSRRKDYGKLFALTIFAPFISFCTIIFTQINLYIFFIATVFAIYLAYKSCPQRFKKVFATKFEKFLFWSIWVVANSFLFVIVVNILSKSLK